MAADDGGNAVEPTSLSRNAIVIVGDGKQEARERLDRRARVR